MFKRTYTEIGTFVDAVVDRVIESHGGPTGGYSYAAGYLSAILTDAIYKMPTDEAHKLMEGMKAFALDK